MSGPTIANETPQEAAGVIPVIDQEADEEQYEAQVDAEKANATANGDANGNALAKTQSKASANDISAIPNGGLKAWIQVLGSFILFFNTWGILNTFGVYQTFYESGEIFTASSSDISWIGSVQAFLLLLVGAITGPIYDAGHFRILLIVGTFMLVFGHMMLSLVSELWQAILAQAFVIGIGAGCLFVPAVAIMSTYFTTKISTAIGIAASGSSLGGVIYPIMFYKLIPEVGFGWAVRIIGFMALGMLIIPCTTMQMRVKPPAKRKLIDLSAFKELPYDLFVLASVFGFMGLYLPFFYISYYGLASGATDESLSFYLIPILNAASVFGRIVPNIVADRIGPLNVMVPASAATCILIYCLIAAHSVAGVVLIAIFYGFFSGSFVSLPASIFVALTPPDQRAKIGTRMGQGFSVMSIGVLIGTPIGGAILGSENNFTHLWIFGGTLAIAGTILFAGSRLAKTGPKLMAKT